MKRIISRLIVVGLAAVYLAQSQPAGKISIAVYPIRAVGGVDSSLGPTLTSLIGYELNQSPKFMVIEEAMLKTVMERQAINASDACDDTVCQVAIGKLVQAQKIVVGDLSKLGSHYILTLKLIDVRSGTTEATTKDKCACTEDQLDQLVAVATVKIRNFYGERIAVPALPQGYDSQSSKAAPLPEAASRTSSPLANAQTTHPDEVGRKIEDSRRIFQALGINTSKEQKVLQAEKVYVQGIQTQKSNVTKIYASIIINAPKENVWKAITNFDDYGEFMPSYKSAQVLEKSGQKVLLKSKMEISLLDADVKEEYLLSAQNLEMFWSILEYRVDGLGRPDWLAELGSVFFGLRLEPIASKQTKIMIVRQGTVTGILAGPVTAFGKGSAESMMINQCKAIKKRSELMNK